LHNASKITHPVGGQIYSALLVTLEVWHASWHVKPHFHSIIVDQDPVESTKRASTLNIWTACTI